MISAASIGSLSEAMARAAARDLEAPIEHCPGWLMRDLVVHIGEVQWFWAEIVGRGLTDRALVDMSARVADRSDPIGWFRAQTIRLVGALEAAADADPVWTWWPPEQTVGFVRRRQLIEVAIHGWDGAHAVGAEAPLPIDVALTGLQEFSDVMSRDLRSDVAPPPRLECVCSDIDRSFVLFDGEPASSMTGDAAVSLRHEATASELLLALWGRLAVRDPEVSAALACIDLS